MQAIRQIKKLNGNKVTVDLPANFKSNMVEVIVLPMGASEGKMSKTSKKKSLLVYLDTLKTKDLKKRTRKAIDGELSTERDSWG